MVDYRPGDVVNGHRLNESGTQWIPIGPPHPVSRVGLHYADGAASPGPGTGGQGADPWSFGGGWASPHQEPPPTASSMRSSGALRWLVGTATVGLFFAALVSVAGQSETTVDEALAQEVVAAYDTTVAIMQGWDSTFEAPDLEYVGGTMSVNGESFDRDGAYYYEGTVYLGTEWLAMVDTMTDEVAGTVAHELGHAFDGQDGTYAPTEMGREQYADCIEGAVGAEAGWDTEALAENNYAFGDVEGEDPSHGTPQQRYDATLDGAEHGYEYCEAKY